MSIYTDLINHKKKLCVVGLGYVGMPIAIEFAKHVDTIGFDINSKKVALFKSGIDPTKEVGDEEIKKTNLFWTDDENHIGEASFIIVAVPTPINKDTTPDLEPLVSSSTIVGRNLKRGSIVVYESTVYPGVTEDVCVPILEKQSGLKCGIDFKIGYSPERINPGDKEHKLFNIKKIVSGIDDDSLREISKIYQIVVKAGVFEATSIKVAEAAKVIENSQRDINIAFMNELSIIFNKLGIDTNEVLKAAGTKWNFLPFKPGLVGGHCIGIDPYYLTYCAEQLGYHSQVILSGRRINDSMGKYVAEQTVKKLISSGKAIKEAKVGCLGITFKENCPDVRNSKVVDIIHELNEYGIEPLIYDPVADKEDVKKIYGLDLCCKQFIKELDCLIIAVAHDEFKKLSPADINDLFKKNCLDKIIIDVKGILDKHDFDSNEFIIWRL